MIHPPQKTRNMMNTPEQMPLELNIRRFIGLTDWAEGRPPSVGWWETRSNSVEHGSLSSRTALIERRWWDGENWSLQVDMGLSDEEAERRRAVVGIRGPFCVQFRGLRSAHPDGYTYSLDPTHRVNLARTIERRRVPLEEAP